MFYIFDSEFDCPIAKTCLKSGDGEPWTHSHSLGTELKWQQCGCFPNFSVDKCSFQKNPQHPGSHSLSLPEPTDSTYGLTYSFLQNFWYKAQRFSTGLFTSCIWTATQLYKITVTVQLTAKTTNYENWTKDQTIVKWNRSVRDAAEGRAPFNTITGQQPSPPDEGIQREKHSTGIFIYKSVITKIKSCTCDNKTMSKHNRTPPTHDQNAVKQT